MTTEITTNLPHCPLPGCEGRDERPDGRTAGSGG